MDCCSCAGGALRGVGASVARLVVSHKGRAERASDRAAYAASAAQSGRAARGRVRLGPGVNIAGVRVSVKLAQLLSVNVGEALAVSWLSSRESQC